MGRWGAARANQVRRLLALRRASVWWWWPARVQADPRQAEWLTLQAKQWTDAMYVSTSPDEARRCALAAAAGTAHRHEAPVWHLWQPCARALLRGASGATRPALLPPRSPPRSARRSALFSPWVVRCFAAARRRQRAQSRGGAQRAPAVAHAPTCMDGLGCVARRVNATHTGTTGWAWSCRTRPRRWTRCERMRECRWAGPPACLGTPRAAGGLAPTRLLFCARSGSPRWRSLVLTSPHCVFLLPAPLCAECRYICRCVSRGRLALLSDNRTKVGLALHGQGFARATRAGDDACARPRCAAGTAGV